jgi:hypothetical protein
MPITVLIPIGMPGNPVHYLFLLKQYENRFASLLLADLMEHQNTMNAGPGTIGPLSFSKSAWIFVLFIFFVPEISVLNVIPCLGTDSFLQRECR